MSPSGKASTSAPARVSAPDDGTSSVAGRVDAIADCKLRTQFCSDIFITSTQESSHAINRRGKRKLARPHRPTYRQENQWYHEPTPQLFQRIRAQARDKAVAALGLTELLAEQHQIEQQKKDLEDRELEVCRQSLALLRGVDPHKVDNYSRYQSDAEVGKAINLRQLQTEE